MSDERGSVLPLVALLTLAIGGLVVGVGTVGGEVVAASRAASAAEAAALAGAAAGEGAARRVAAANGGELVAFEVDGAAAQVEVRLGGAAAQARALRVAAPAPAAGVIGLRAELRAAVAAAEAALGRPLRITSGWRSPAAQQALWDRRATNPFPVAPPGTSAHERGEAIDVHRSDAEALAAVGPAVGLCRPLPASDPIHFELCRAKRAS